VLLRRRALDWLSWSRLGWLRPPSDLLARVRWAFLLVAFFNAGLSLLLIGVSDADLPARVAGVLATFYLCWRWQRGYTTGRFGILAELLAGVALVLLGIGAGDPLRAAMVLYMGLYFQALYVGGRRLSLAIAVNVGAYGVAVWLSPTTESLTLWSPEVLMQPPGVVLVVVMSLLGNSLARHERAAARERALARFGSALVASSDRQAVYAATMEGVRALVGPHAEVDAVLAVGDIERVQIVAATGSHTARWQGQFFDVHPATRPGLLAGGLFELDAAVVEGLLAAAGQQDWRGTNVVSSLLVHGTVHGSLTVITPTSLPDECKDGLRALSTEVALALETHDLREELAHQAFHDPLTNLANRALLVDRARQALSRAARHDEATAILLLDLDGFKTVNDSLGHQAGDGVLMAIAERLHACLRVGDTAARLGGDEFAVLLERLDDPLAESGAIAQRILDALVAPVSLPTQEVFVSASVGIAVARGAADVDELLSQADTAMYAAKRNGKGRYSVFEPNLRADALRRLELETDLRRAIDAEQFVLHYQPIVRLADQRPVGLEALVRWQHPRRGMVPPDAFIPLAEETGLIVPLGRWVLGESARQLARLRSECPTQWPLRMSVNVAARHLLEPGLVDDVEAVLREAGLPADALVLELTEHALIQRSEATLARLHELRDLGVHLALDDFGTGYSSLAYLRDLPFDRVKIDRSFIRDVERQPAQAALVQAIVSLGQALGLKTVGEGVETAAQARQLARLGCDLVQGYHFARPVDAASIGPLLRAGFDAGDADAALDAAA